MNCHVVLLLHAHVGVTRRICVGGRPIMTYESAELETQKHTQLMGNKQMSISQPVVVQNEGELRT